MIINFDSESFVIRTEVIADANMEILTGEYNDTMDKLRFAGHKILSVESFTLADAGCGGKLGFIFTFKAAVVKDPSDTK